MMTRFPVKKILILGGGTAGWLAAGYFSSQLPGVQIQVVESGQEKIIGVGETTVPQIRHHLERMGIDEDTWMRETGAVFKYGSRFVGWQTGSDVRIHGFSDYLTEKAISHSPNEFNKAVSQIQDDNTVDLDYWIHMLQSGDINPSESHLIGIEAHHFIEHGLAHRDFAGHQYFSRVPGYAYNLDAHKFGKAIQKLVAKPKGVQQVIAHINEVVRNDDGSVKELVANDGTRYSADLYIDCTGFKRLLIGPLTKWRSKEAQLGKKAVVAGRVNYNNDEHIWCTPALDATALRNGWSWRIPLRDDMGSGYVYNPDYISQDQAEQEFVNHWRERGKEVDVAVRLNFDSGALEHGACHNVVSAGLANNFLEPLEATSISFSALVNDLVVDVLKKNDGYWGSRDALAVSRLMTREIDYTADYLWLHYALSKRSDTQFWRDKLQQRDQGLAVAHKWFAQDTNIYRREKDFGHTRLNKFDWALMLTTMQAWHNCPTSTINPDWIPRAKLYYKFKQQMTQTVNQLVPSHWDLIQHINQ